VGREIGDRGDPPSKDGDKSVPATDGGYYSRLTARFVLITLTCSIVPLLVGGWGMYAHYSRFARERTTRLFETRVMHHRRVIELYLAERSSCLKVLAEMESADELTRPGRLAEVLKLLNAEYGGSFGDLGVIGDDGRHLAYAGPYALMDKNYAGALWFGQVMEKGIYISDMFTGFRGVPHFVIAVRRDEGGRPWILRATVATEPFQDLVSGLRFGESGEVYLVNREGVYQTAPRFVGRVMEQSPFAMPALQPGTVVEVMEGAEERDKSVPATMSVPATRSVPPTMARGQRIVARSWLEDPKWMLVVSQDYGEAFADVGHAQRVMALALVVSALTIVAVSWLTARRMAGAVRERDRERERLNRKLMETSRMATIGELSAGVAHEINNPLAIILTEKELMADYLAAAAGVAPEFRGQLAESLEQIGAQIRRCKRITQGLLKFSRPAGPALERVDLNSLLKEILDLLGREARGDGIEFRAEFEAGLPEILADPAELQQVFMNLIGNAIDAHEGRRGGTIRIVTAAGDGGVKVAVADSGPGIKREHLDKIFEPFFTTKPVGKGTGLGLWICYNILQRRGGSISVRSEPGRGTEFEVLLPSSPPGRTGEHAEQGGSG